MAFTLEALRAKHGDSLLLYYDDPNQNSGQRIVLIDGGPSGVYRRFVRPRLEELRDERDLAEDDPLRIELVVVSHIDDDHIRGLLDMTAELRRLKNDSEPVPFDLRGLWHNSFDDVLGNRIERLGEAAQEAIGTASTTDELPPGLGREHPSAIVLASVRQGRQLRLDAERLGVRINRGDGVPLLATGDEGQDVVRIRGGLRLHIVGPLLQQVDDLQEEWDEEIERLGLARRSAVELAEYLDESVFNLASLVLVAEANGKRMLLTGDARGDTVLTGLEQAGLLEPGGSVRFDLLKLPHHGSDRNVEPDFFERILADHYVVSGDGRHGNPEPETLEMLLAARAAHPDEPFHLHLTYAPEEMENHPIPGLREILNRAEEGGAIVHFPGAGEQSLRIELG